jgi:hypothetical protein
LLNVLPLLVVALRLPPVAGDLVTVALSRVPLVGMKTLEMEVDSAILMVDGTAVTATVQLGVGTVRIICPLHLSAPNIVPPALTVYAPGAVAVKGILYELPLPLVDPRVPLEPLPVNEALLMLPFVGVKVAVIVELVPIIGVMFVL